MKAARKLAAFAANRTSKPGGLPWPVWLLPLLLLAGCFHHQPPPPPPVASGPPPLPTSITNIPQLPPAVPDPSRPDVAMGEPAATVTPPPAPRTHRAVRRRKVVDAPTTASTAGGTAPAAAATEAQGAAVPGAQAANKPPELGQLSAGNGADSKERSSMLDQLHTLEIRFAGIKRPQNSDEEATATQIRLFLAKARQAILADDLDGARTLALKAKVLLDELTDL